MKEAVPADAVGSSREIDDLSSGFHRVRSRLVDSRGLRYYDFRKNLTPRFWRVWLEMLAGHGVVIGLAVALLSMRYESLGVQVAVGCAAALVFGVSFAYISLFFHAASHYELWPTRRLNDLLADVFIGVLSAYPMSAYRPVHFDHHRHLGLPEDPERSYIEALDVWMLVESLTGIRFARLAIAHVFGRSSGHPPVKVDGKRPFNWLLPFSLVLHIGVVAGALARGAIALAVAWGLGFVVVARFVGILRIVLEHRSAWADPKIDYTQVSHGAVSRIFGDGPIAQTLGGAGFNRHLLHHWDPQVPYTRLKDLERYLRDTELRPLIEARSTSYVTTFLTLFRP